MFEIYRSGAGSGKTFTLVKAFLKLALESKHPSYFKTILAITFTNDATKEMKYRIIKDLSQLAQLDNLPPSELKHSDNTMLKILSRDLNIKPKILVQQAKKVHKTLLHNYSNFNIQTIDAFNSQIIRAFHKDLGLSYDYQLVIDREEIIEQTITLLLEEAQKKENALLKRFLITFAKDKLEQGKSWHLGTDLRKFTENLFAETKNPFIKILKDKPLSQFWQLNLDLTKFLTAFEGYIKKTAQKALEKIHRHGLDFQDFYYKKRGIYGYFTNHAGFNIYATPLKKIQPNSYVFKTIEDAKWAGGKIENPNIDTVKNDLIHIFHLLESYKKDHKATFFLAKTLKKNIYLMGLVSRIGCDLELIKEKNNWLSISDFNPILERIISTSPAAYIYERIGEKYRHILIDEFQDTSLMQWHNLLPLLLNGLSQGHYSMVVGDCKQAIYRWRGGAAETLALLPEISSLSSENPIYSELQSLKQTTHINYLNTNYRSQQKIIDFNNDFFDYIYKASSKTYPNLKQYYEQVTQDYKKESQKMNWSKVELTFLPFSTKENYQETTILKMIMLIKDLINQGFHKKDIAILARTNSQITLIAEALTEHKIPIISDESLLIAKSSSIQLITHFLELLYRQTSHAQFHFLIQLVQHTQFYPFSNIKPLNGNDWQEVKQILSENNLLTFFSWLNKRYNFQFSEQNFNTLSLYDIATEAIRQFSLDKIDNQQVYIEKFLEVILFFSTTKSNLLHDFLEFWEKNKSKISINALEAIDAVQVMSIHKSKGLEFEIVLLPFVDWTLEAHKDTTLWQILEKNPFNKEKDQVAILPFHADLQETAFKIPYLEEKEKIFIDTLNILYVALTRAKKQLYSISQHPKSFNLFPEIKRINQLFINWIENTNLEYQKNQEPLKVDFNSEQDFDQIRYIFQEDQRKPLKSSMPLINFKDTEALKITHKLKQVLRKSLKVRHKDLEDYEDYSLVDRIEDPLKRGIMIHQALQQINYNDEINSTLDLLKFKGLILDNEKNDLAQRIENILNCPEIATYYKRDEGFKILNEKEMYFKTAASTFRADRIVLAKDKTIIIDYKTGQIDSKHQKQMAHYEKILTTMGFSHVSTFLVYIDHNKIITC